MDEAEYCDRVSIMVDGKIEALDTPSGLKKRFGVENGCGVFDVGTTEMSWQFSVGSPLD